MVIMQKAVTPALSHAYLTQGYDRFAGFCVRAEDIAFATTPALLYGAHALSYPGSPFRSDAAWIDILRFDAAPRLQFEPAREHLLPLWWMRHTRVVPGAELIRVFADRTSVLLARYGDIGTGWVATTMPAALQRRAALSRCVGPVASYHGAYVEADLLDEGRGIAIALVNPPLSENGFQPTPAGRWRKVVPAHLLDDVFELSITASWAGLPVRVVDQWEDASREITFRVSSIGHDDDLARALRLEQIEAGVWEGSVPASQLTDLQTIQLRPSPPVTPARGTPALEQRAYAS